MSLVRRGRIPWTRETRVGHPVYGAITGFPSVDVRSIGAGGGSDRLGRRGRAAARRAAERRRRPRPGLLRRGGDAADRHRRVPPARLHRPRLLPRRRDGVSTSTSRGRTRSSATSPGRSAWTSSRPRWRSSGSRPSGWSRAIEEITLSQGIDPREAVMIGGGGGAGLYSVGIARRLGARASSSPRSRPRCRATGALISDLQRDFTRHRGDVDPGVRPRPRQRRCSTGLGARVRGVRREAPARSRLVGRSRSRSRRGTRTRCGRSRCRCPSTASPAPTRWRRCAGLPRGARGALRRRATPTPRWRSSPGAPTRGATSVSALDLPAAPAPARRRGQRARRLLSRSSACVDDPVRAARRAQPSARSSRGRCIVESPVTTVVVDPLVVGRAAAERDRCCMRVHRLGRLPGPGGGRPVPEAVDAHDP